MPVARLSSYYFFYFTLFGTFLPFFGLYMQSLEFSALQIGQVMAVLIGTKVVAPYVWGWLADRTGRMMRWVRWCMGLSALTSIALIWSDDFVSVTLVVAIFSFFWHGGLPLFEAYTFRQLAEKKESYGKIRLWGSVGFIAAVLLLGELFSRYELAYFPWVVLGLFVLLWLTTWTLGELPTRPGVQADQKFSQVLANPVAWSLLLVSFLIQFSHGTYYNFFSIDLEANGYSKSTISWLWAVGVGAEIFVFFAMVQLFRFTSVRNLILLSLGLTLLRWQLNMWGMDSLAMLILAQTFHAASFGLYHAAALHLIDDLFNGSNQSRGQAIYAATSQGLGGALGALVAGLTWTLGGAMLSYTVSSLAVLLGILISWYWLRPSVRGSVL